VPAKGTKKISQIEYSTKTCCTQEEKEVKKMVTASIYLYDSDEFRVYIDKFADEFILTIKTPDGTLNFITTDLTKLEELIRKTLMVVKYNQLLLEREEIV
jgi:hypothetical protein